MGVASVTDFVKALGTDRWLVLGKGPTAAPFLADPALAAGYRVLTLNHACLKVTPALAHFVDWDAFAACGDHLANAELPTCLPWFPHERNTATNRSLLKRAKLFGENGPAGIALAWLSAKEKLFAYNSTTAPRQSVPHHALPHVRLRYFSAVAAFNILAVSGVKVIHSAGVDGGTGYAAGFDPQTHLANGRTTFDAQLPELAAAVKRHGIEWVKLGHTEG